MDWLGLTSTLFGSSVAVAKSGYFVKTGEVGALTTFGAVKRGSDGKIVLIYEGFKFVVPFAQTIIKVHTKKNTEAFSDLFITLKNGISYKFNAYIVYHVMNDPISIENILFTLDNYKEFVQITFEKAIQQSLEGLSEINNVLGLCEGRASRHKRSNLAQCLIVVQMFNKPLMPCFCKTLVMGSCFRGVQNLVK